jgi:hypothetical protein
MRSNDSVMTARTPSGLVPLAAQSRDEPDPYSLPPSNTSGMPCAAWSVRWVRAVGEGLTWSFSHMRAPLRRRAVAWRHPLALDRRTAGISGAKRPAAQCVPAVRCSPGRSLRTLGTICVGLMSS